MISPFGELAAGDQCVAIQRNSEMIHRSIGRRLQERAGDLVAEEHWKFQSGIFALEEICST